MKKFIAILISIFVLLMPALAQTTPQPAPKRIVIHAGRLLDVKTGKMLTNQSIYIEGDKIARIEPAHR